MQSDDKNKKREKLMELDQASQVRGGDVTKDEANLIRGGKSKKSSSGSSTPPPK